MILADTSVWIEHFRMPNLVLSRAVTEQTLLMHPYVVGELALGSLRDRQRTINTMNDYEMAPIASHEEALAMVEFHQLYSRGLGYVDLHLLASCFLHGQCKLLTRDRRLHETAQYLGIAA